MLSDITNSNTCLTENATLQLDIPVPEHLWKCHHVVTVEGYKVTARGSHIDIVSVPKVAELEVV